MPSWALTSCANRDLTGQRRAKDPVVSTIIDCVFILFLLVGVPALSIWTARGESLSSLSRAQLYLSAALSQWLLAGLTAVVASLTPTGFAGFRAIRPAAFVGWTTLLAVISLGGLGAVLILERWGWWPEESKWVYLLIPRTRNEKLWAALLLAPTAGFCEEFIYRGYLLAHLSRYLHSAAWGWVISSIAFGLAHTYQKRNGVARAALLGALLAWPVVRTGSVFPSMAAHFVIDAVALVWLGPLSLKPDPVER